jgi:hypothetical protein
MLPCYFYFAAQVLLGSFAFPGFFPFQGFAVDLPAVIINIYYIIMAVAINTSRHVIKLVSKASAKCEKPLEGWALLASCREELRIETCLVSGMCFRWHADGNDEWSG